MKTLSQVSLIIFLAFYSINVFAQTGFRLSGTVKGIDSGMVRMFSANNTVTDSAVITHGKFTMAGLMGLPDARRFMVSPGNWGFRAFVENTSIAITIDTADAQHQYYQGEDHPLIWRIEQRGSEFADTFSGYLNETGLGYFMSLLKELKFAPAANRAAITAKMDSVRNTMLLKQKTWIENYIQQNPTSIAGVFIFNEAYHTSVFADREGALQFALSRFSGAATTSPYYKALLQEAGNMKNILVNAQAPDFALQKRDKSIFRLSSTKGKIVLIDFWASWCVPCRAAIPGWKKVYSKYHNKGFDIVSVADDDNRKAWTTALDKEKMPWTQVVEDFSGKSNSKVMDLFPNRTIPFYVLLDREGKVLAASGSDEVIAKKIAEVLN